jgi:Fasciclin domain
MKAFKNIFKLSLLMSIMSIIFSSCGDLALQKTNEFQPGILPTNNYNDVLAWDFIQQQTSPVGTTPAANKLDYMITLIKVAGLEEEYKKPNTDRTFLLLNNSAFTGAGKINALLTGVVLGTGDLTKVDKTRAANLLKYHIVNAYVNQSTSLPIYAVNYDFNTLLEGPNGIIKIQRNERYALTINSSADLPTTRRTTGVTLHNYQFKNGIGHFISAYVGLTAF